jgi:uncharacterized protein DUF4136
MKFALTIIGIIVLASVLLCPTANAQKTTAAHDKNVNFANFKTFMFSEKSGARNPLVNEMILAAVERELTAKGLTKKDADADLKVVYLAASGFDLQVASVPFYTEVNAAYSGNVAAASATMWDVTTGTLVIDLYDTKADRVVFRGTAKDVLQRAPSADMAADAKLVTKPVNKGIAKIFKKYPVPGK